MKDGGMARWHSTNSRPSEALFGLFTEVGHGHACIASFTFCFLSGVVHREPQVVAVITSS